MSEQIIIFSALAVPRNTGPMLAGEPQITAGMLLQPYSGFPTLIFKAAVSPCVTAIVAIADELEGIVEAASVRSGDIFRVVVPAGKSVSKGSMVKVSPSASGKVEQANSSVVLDVAVSLAYALEDITVSGVDSFLKVILV